MKRSSDRYDFSRWDELTLFKWLGSCRKRLVSRVEHPTGDCYLSTTPLPNINRVLTLLSIDDVKAFKLLFLNTYIYVNAFHPLSFMTLQPRLARALSTVSTRSSFKLLRCRTPLDKNSFLPNLTRLLAKPTQKFERFLPNFAEEQYFLTLKITFIFLVTVPFVGPFKCH